MTRTEILTRYRRLRQISKELHQAVLDVVAPKVVLDWAKRLGLARGRTVLLESEQEMILAEDLAIYLARPGRSHPLDRYTQAARLPPGTDEAIVLEAMRQAQFSLWRIGRRQDLMEEAFARAPALRRVQGEALARDPHFAISIYRVAVATGAMNAVRFKRG